MFPESQLHHPKPLSAGIFALLLYLLVCVDIKVVS